MKNKELKKQLVNNGTFNEYRKQRFSMFEELKKQIEQESDVNKKREIMSKIDDFNSYFDENGEQFNELKNKCCQELKEARKKQVKKIREHILYWLNNDYKIFFGTFTYDDKKRRKEIKENVLKKYVINTITNICDDYIINIDYGKENERLHFHTLVAIKKDNLTNDYWYELEKRNKGTREKPRWVQGDKLIHKNLLEYENKVGWYDMEPCSDTEESAKKLSRYIDKLTLHSIKVKQNYVSVKKGTEYQQMKLIKKSITKQVIKDKRESKTRDRNITYQNYLKGLRNVDKKINITAYVEKEYFILDKIRNEKERIKNENDKKIVEILKKRNLRPTTL